VASSVQCFYSNNRSRSDKLKVLTEQLTNKWCNFGWDGKLAWVWSAHLVSNVPVVDPPSTIKIGSFNCLHLGWGNSKDIDLLAKQISNFEVWAIIEVMSERPEEELLIALSKATSEKTGKDVGGS
jgi:hypothetical protein